MLEGENRRPIILSRHIFSLPFQDTRVGQLLLATSYALPCFLRGTHLTTDKRDKVVEYWHEAARTLPPGELPSKEKLADLFKLSGMQLLAEDEDLAAFYRHDVLDEKAALVGHIGDAVSAVDATEDFCMQREREALLKYSDHTSIQIVLEPLPLLCHRGLLIPKARSDILSYARLPASGIDRKESRHLQAGLQRQRDFCRKLLQAKKGFAHKLRLLRFVTSIAVWLTSLKKLFKVPDITSFLPPFPSEQLATSRELPPIFIHKPPQCYPTTAGRTVTCIRAGGAVLVKTTQSVKEAGTVMAAAYDYLLEIARECRTEELFASSITPLAGQQYYVMGIVLESFYPNSPKVRLKNSMVLF